MSNSTAFIRRCLEAGMPIEFALIAAEAFEVEAPLYAPPPSKAALRQRKYRQDAKAKNGDNAGQRERTRDNALRSVDHVTDREAAKDAPAPTCIRGEDNPSRLVDTCTAVAVVAEAREPGSDWPEGDANQHAKLLAQAAASSRLDPAKQPGLITTAGRIAAWKRDGASWTYDVVPAVTIMSQKRGPPIATWKYFDPAIAQSIADNRRALDIPTAANGPRHERLDQPSAKLAAKQANLDRAFRSAQRVAGRR